MNHVPAWIQLLDIALENQHAKPVLQGLVEDAREVLAADIVRRVYRLEDVGVVGRTWRDPRVDSPRTDPAVRELAALAHSDCGTCGTAGRELELLACAFRVTGERIFLDRVLAQLEEMSTWRPLQRPGWNYAQPGADGKGGTWLATGGGVHAIVHTLGLLHDGAIPGPLRAALERLLEAEIEEVVDDWAAGRSWFIRTKNAITNQWIAPTAALVQACLLLGPERFPAAWRLGVANLRMSVDAHDAEGSFEEGLGYAHYVSHLFYAAHAMAVRGDRELYDRPFFQNFGTWYVHHFQPGGFFVNCFDARTTARLTLDAVEQTGHQALRHRGGKSPAQARANMLALIAVCSGNRDAIWAIRHFCDQPPASLAGLAAAALQPPTDSYQPALFAAYDRATRVNWRSSWDSHASGVWIRGGHPLDQHDHCDRGHVNFIVEGRPILIEAGTPSYANPKLATHYASGVGHNVLQVGLVAPENAGNAARLHPPRGWQRAKAVVPLVVHSLNRLGGEVEFDAAQAYEGVLKWNRHVSWDASTLRIGDTVVLHPNEPEVVLFRWHLGTSEAVSISSLPGEIVASWNGGCVRMKSECQLDVSCQMMPDHTLTMRFPELGHEDVDALHACLIVRTRESVAEVSIETIVTG